jgi:bis(5'-nucleosidyl)-tetraphosphatase
MIKEISYGIVPVREDKILLLRVYDTFDFPKGKPDPDESPLQTAIRELFEETNLSDPQFQWGLDFQESLPYKKGKKVACYFLASCPEGDVRLLPNPQTGMTEHHGFVWLSPEEARLKVKDRLYPVVDWVISRIGNAEKKIEITT